MSKLQKELLAVLNAQLKRVGLPYDVQKVLGATALVKVSRGSNRKVSAVKITGVSYDNGSNRDVEILTSDPNITLHHVPADDAKRVYWYIPRGGECMIELELLL